MYFLIVVVNELMRICYVLVIYFLFVEGFIDLKNDFDFLEVKLSWMKQVDVLFIDDLFKLVNGKLCVIDW